MKVYFTAAIYHRERMKQYYQAIIEGIKKLGHEYIESFDVIHEPLSVALSADTANHEQYFLKWKQTIVQADVAVVEATFPGTVHIGMEIGALLEHGKPVICLYTKGNDPTFVTEFHSLRLIKLEYDIDSVNQVLKYGFEEAEKMLNRRFTMFITPEIETFLDKTSSDKGISRSEFIRGLIERERIK